MHVIFCSSKISVFLEPGTFSQKTVRFTGQVMSDDKYPSVFSRYFTVGYHLDVVVKLVRLSDL